MPQQKIYEQPLYPYQRSSDQEAVEPNRRPVVIVGAGPIGLAAAIDLALQGIASVVIDDNDAVSWGSRAICFSKRSLEILDRLGCGERLHHKGVTWNLGKVFVEERQIYQFNLLPEPHHKFPAFINIQQYYVESYLVERCLEFPDLIELRGKNRLIGLDSQPDQVLLTLETPEGSYRLVADWVLACDGANSTCRRLLGLDFVGRVFEDNFLIADVMMEADFPVERRFWFNPPFNPGQSALLHKQPDGVWRIDLQLGWDIDKEQERQPERVIPRLRAMLGEEVDFTLEWVSIYTFQCRRMERFRHGRVLFAGDSAHQVSPFGARGANSGLQDIDNLCWKLKLVMQKKAPETLLDSYDWERTRAADDNILNSSRSTDFITPKSAISRLFRDAVLELAEHHDFARPLVNSGRLSRPFCYDLSPLNALEEEAKLPESVRPGAPLVDAPTGTGWLSEKLGDGFQLLAINRPVDKIEDQGVSAEPLLLSTSSDSTGALQQRYLGTQSQAVYLIRPDQHIAGRWVSPTIEQLRAGLQQARGFAGER